MSPFALWVFTLIAFLSPTKKDDERHDRYEQIAMDLAAVLDAEPPLPGKTIDETAAIVVAIAFYESGGFDPRVDSATCSKDVCGFRGGRQVCLMQVYYPAGVEELNGYARAEVEQDRRTCFRAALTIMRASWSRCRAQDTRLNAYASGSCAVGTANTRMKLATAHRLLHALPYEP